MRRLVLVLFLLVPSLALGDELSLGKSLLERGKLEDAARVLEKGVAGPVKQNAEAWLTLGKAQIGLSRLDAALASLAEAQRLKGGYEAYLYQGVALDLAGRGPEAMKAFAAAAKEDPVRAEPHAFLGLAQLSAGDAKAAVKSLRRADELAPGKVEVLTDLGYALVRSGQAKEAIEVLKRALQKDPTSADALYNLGDAYAATADETRAIDAYERAVFRDPRHHRAQFHLGLLREKRKEHDKAIAAYLAALAGSPEDPEILLALSRAYTAAGKPDEVAKLKARLEAAGKKREP